MEKNPIDVQTLREAIPGLDKLTAVSQIHKGFSYDAKYFLFLDSAEPAYVLRTAPLNKTEQKRKEFEAVRLVHEKGVQTSAPVQFGTIEALGICYALLSYVQGEDAYEILPTLSADEQYQVGIRAGQELRLMHEIPALPQLEAWHIRRAAKHYKQYEAYRNCGVQHPKETAVITFINENLHWMEGRPDCFQHDDFHPSNLLVHNRVYAGAIDYNRYDWGDPYHDFLKIAYFSREVSIPFSRGQIDGYFEGEVPSLFWKLYTLYTAMIVLPTITWTLQVVPEQLDSMLERIRVVLEDHNDFEKVIPDWYAGGEK